MPLTSDLLKIEKSFWLGGPDKELPTRNVSSPLPRWQTLSNEAIANTAEKGRWKDVAMTPKGTLELGDVTIVTYEAAAIRADGHALKAIVSSGYVKRGNDWKLAFHQQTPAAAV